MTWKWEFRSLGILSLRLQNISHLLRLKKLQSRSTRVEIKQSKLLFIHYENTWYKKKGTIQNVLKLAKSLHTAIHRNTKKSQFSAMCIKLWPLSVEVCKGTRFYPDFLHFKTIDKRNKDVVNITPLKMLSKNLKKLDGNLTSNIKVHVVF